MTSSLTSSDLSTELCVQGPEHGWNYPDGLFVGKGGMTDAEESSHFYPVHNCESVNLPGHFNIIIAAMMVDSYDASIKCMLGSTAPCSRCGAWSSLR